MKIEEAVEKLAAFKPKSIFLYGSQAVGETNSSSDYEIGVVFDEENYVGRVVLRQQVPDEKFAIFPFKKEELETYNIDTPFQKNIYIAAMIMGGAKTVFGEKIVESLPVPKISTMDLLMDCSFLLGRALSAVIVAKENHLRLANEMLYKSAFFATRNLIFSKTGKLINGYNNIFDQAKLLDLPEEYKNLLQLCADLRSEKTTDVDTSWYYKNISYINKYIIPIINGE